MRWLRRWAAFGGMTVRTEPGRALAFACGLLFGAPSAAVLLFGDPDRSTTTLAVFFAGVVLIAVGCYRVLRVKAPGGFEFEADPSSGTARYADAGADPSIATTDAENAARYFIAERAIAALMRPRDGPLRNCSLHLYLYDSPLDRLLPVFEVDADAESWPTTNGCVGAAWTCGHYVRAVGSAVSDATYGLAPEQRARYAHVGAVAATPIVNAAGAVLGVLAAETDAVDHGLATADAEDELIALAAGVARLLVDLLRWFSDVDDVVVG